MAKPSLLLAAIALLSSCRTLAGMHEIVGTRWDVTRINAIAATGFISFGSNHFEADFGCNRVRGHYRIDGEILVIGAVDKSHMACVSLDPADDRQPVSAMQLEDAALVALSGTVRQIWQGKDSLLLRGTGGEIALVRRSNRPNPK